MQKTFIFDSTYYLNLFKTRGGFTNATWRLYIHTKYFYISYMYINMNVMRGVGEERRRDGGEDIVTFPF